MEAENFEKVLLKESLHRSSQNNMNQAEAGYNAKWFRRGGLFAFKWLQKRSVLDFIEGAKWQEQKTIEEVFEWLTTNNYLTDLKETLIKDFNQFKKK